MRTVDCPVLTRNRHLLLYVFVKKIIVCRQEQLAAIVIVSGTNFELAVVCLALKNTRHLFISYLFLTQFSFLWHTHEHGHTHALTRTHAGTKSENEIVALFLPDNFYWYYLLRWRVLSITRGGGGRVLATERERKNDSSITESDVDHRRKVPERIGQTEAIFEKRQTEKQNVYPADRNTDSDTCRTSVKASTE